MQTFTLKTVRFHVHTNFEGCTCDIITRPLFQEVQIGDSIADHRKKDDVLVREPSPKDADERIVNKDRGSKSEE